MSESVQWPWLLREGQCLPLVSPKPTVQNIRTVPLLFILVEHRTGGLAIYFELGGLGSRVCFHGDTDSLGFGAAVFFSRSNFSFTLNLAAMTGGISFQIVLVGRVPSTKRGLTVLTRTTMPTHW